MLSIQHSRLLFIGGLLAVISLGAHWGASSNFGFISLPTLQIIDPNSASYINVAGPQGYESYTGPQYDLGGFPMFFPMGGSSTVRGYQHSARIFIVGSLLFGLFAAQRRSRTFMHIALGIAVAGLLLTVSGSVTTLGWILLAAAIVCVLFASNAAPAWLRSFYSKTHTS